MGIENTLISMIKEIVYFDIWEMLFFFSLYVVEIKKNISIKKSIFHIFMLSFLDYFVANVIVIPILMQITIIVLMSLYYTVVFKTKLLKNLFIGVKVFFLLFILETICDIVYTSLLHIQLLGIQNDFTKFIYMIPIRIVEIIFIYIYYRIFAKGGEK